MSATPSPRVSTSSPELPGYPRLWLATTPSTNDAARHWALQGAPDGALVTAHAQTAGRGQRGHTWSSPPGLGLPDLTVKYPNDILCRGKKICGILAEPRLTPTHVEFVILGIGLNLLQTPTDFPPDIRPRATSCLIEGHPSPIPPVLDLLSHSLRTTRATPYPRLHTLWLRSGAKPPPA